MYRIGMFSKMNKITIKTLRHYDEVGLLHPAHIDEFTGYRYYTTDQLPQLHRILALRQIGFSIEEIKNVLDGAFVEAILMKKKAHLLKNIAEDMSKLSQVEYYMAHKGEEMSKYHVIVKEIPECIVASYRQVIDGYEDLMSIYPMAGEEMERLGCVCVEPEYCFTVYHDGEYKEEDIDVEICQAIVEAKEDTDIVKFHTIKAIKEAACVLHKGPYREFPKAYGALMQWMEENGYELDGYARESYIDGVWNKESEDDWLTEVQFPIKKVDKKTVGNV